MKQYGASLLPILSLLFFSGCEKRETIDYPMMHDYRVQDVLYAKDSKLKQISIGDGRGTWYVHDEFEYDNLGRISKISRPMYEDGEVNGIISYDIYTYNDKSQLEKIMNYNANLYQGFQNLVTYIYAYDNDGNKRKEVIEYPLIGQNRIDSTLYYYDNNRLTRADFYTDGYHDDVIWSSKRTSYIEYEYDNQGELVKETTYVGAGVDNTLYQYSVHSYKDGLNVKTDVFIYYNVIGKTKLREIRRFYDINDNLIYVESQELSWLSSTMGFVQKYEYN